MTCHVVEKGLGKAAAAADGVGRLRADVMEADLGEADGIDRLRIRPRRAERRRKALRRITPIRLRQSWMR